MKKNYYITGGAALALACLALSFLAIRQARPVNPAPRTDELRIRSELIVKNFCRRLSDPLANKDDLAISELLFQTKADYPEVAEIIVAGNKGKVAASTMEESVGQDLVLPAGINRGRGVFPGGGNGVSMP